MTCIYIYIISFEHENEILLLTINKWVEEGRLIQVSNSKKANEATSVENFFFWQKYLREISM